jgi:hypothetical protein
MRATGLDVFMQTSTTIKRFSLNVLCGDISDKQPGPHISLQCLSGDSGVRFFQLDRMPSLTTFFCEHECRYITNMTEHPRISVRTSHEF